MLKEVNGVEHAASNEMPEGNDSQGIVATQKPTPSQVLEVVVGESETASLVPTNNIVQGELVINTDTDSIAALITRMNSKHAVVNIAGKCRVMTMFVDPDTGLEDVQFSSPGDFRSMYCNRIISTSSGEKSLGVLWFMHRARREFEGLTFNPKLTPKGYFNLWTGFGVVPREGDCSLFLAHVRDNIANGDKVIFDYVIAWMANVVQNPQELIGVALALRGSMGTGKGVFANGFGSLFGRHYLQLTQGSQLTGKFNAHMKDKVLVFADEAFWAGDKQAEGVLKALITEPWLVIEGKGENAFKIKNHLHFLFATNNDWVAPAGPQERRFFVLDVGEERLQDHHYFKAIQRELDNGGREALLYYLQNLDISQRNLRQFPQTAALLEQKVYSMTPVQKFWFSKLESGNLSSRQGWDTEIPTKELYADFVRFANDFGSRHKATDSEFGSQLKKLIPGLTTGKGKTSRYGTHRPNVYIVPSLLECRKAFEKFINYPVEWPVYEDEPVVTTVLVAAPVSESAEQE